MSEAPPRVPVRPSYDAELGVTNHRVRPQRAYALVKFTFRATHDGRCSLAEAEPLLHDFRDGGIADLKPGTDFRLVKEETDLVVQGSAYAPSGRPTQTMYVGLEVGQTRKYIAVSGDREILAGRDGRVSIGTAQPFTEMPVTWQRAYGGIDFRAPVLESDPRHVRYLMKSDHPGLYPRNFAGRGYIVAPPTSDEPALMPNLEDPEDLLTAERLVVSDPRLWYRQPLPWCFDWVHPYSFPRHVYFGTDPWYPGPEDASLPEVRRGYAMAGLYSHMEGRHGRYLHPRFMQEASHGLILPRMRGNEVITIHGMHPQLPYVHFRLPFATPPQLTLEIEGRPHQPAPRLHHVVCRPAEHLLTMVYAVDAETPRTFIPGIHKHIPISLRAGNDTPVPFVAPPTVKDQIREAQQRAESQGETP